MKNKTILLTAIILLAACNTLTLSERLASKPAEERAQYLVDKCEDESWRGHDKFGHRHYINKQKNREHVANIKTICNKLAKPSADKDNLIKQCKAEAAKGAYGEEYTYSKHVQNLIEICEAFAETKSKGDK